MEKQQICIHDLWFSGCWRLEESISPPLLCFQVEENHQSWISYTPLPILPRGGEVASLMGSLGWGTDMAPPLWDHSDLLSVL